MIDSTRPAVSMPMPIGGPSNHEPMSGSWLPYSLRDG